jgi:peroxiredoxin
MGQLAIGVHATDFGLKTADGLSRHLSDALQHGPVVLIFYKASCPTCQFTFSLVQQIYSKLGSKAPWVLWGISEDDADETRAFARQYGITFDLLIDEYPYAVSAAYGLQNVPAVFMVQRDGTIGLSDFGFSKDTLNRIAGFEFFIPGDGLPAYRPG